MEKSTTAVIIERGTYTFGHSITNSDGTRQTTSQSWQPGADGGSIIVCGFDTEKCEPICCLLARLTRIWRFTATTPPTYPTSRMRNF